jgi:hypothetical protein
MQRHFHREQPPAKTPAAGPKPLLEMVQLPIFRVHYRRLEEYLAKVYRMEGFDFLLASGAAPGLVPEYAVSTTLPPSEDARRRTDAIRAGRRTHDVALILNVLCLDGYIPAGKYIIDTRMEQSPINQYRTLLRKTGTPESEECRAFWHAHQGSKTFMRLAAEIDATVLNALRKHQTPGS